MPPCCEGNILRESTLTLTSSCIVRRLVVCRRFLERPRSALCSREQSSEHSRIIPTILFVVMFSYLFQYSGQQTLGSSLRFLQPCGHLELHPSTCSTVWEAVITRHWFRSNCFTFHQPCAHSWVSGSPCYLFPHPVFLLRLFLSVNINLFVRCDCHADTSSIGLTLMASTLPRETSHLAAILTSASRNGGKGAPKSSQRRFGHVRRHTRREF